MPFAKKPVDEFTVVVDYTTARLGVQSILRKHKIGQPRLDDILRRWGVSDGAVAGRSRRRTGVNETAFSDVAACSVSQFFVGALAADGYMLPPGRHVSNRSGCVGLDQCKANESLVEAFAAYMNGKTRPWAATGPIKGDSRRYPMVSCRVSSNQVYNDLLKCGVTPFKPTRDFSLAPLHSRHWHRGYVVGDGALGRTKDDGRPWISVRSATKEKIDTLASVWSGVVSLPIVPFTRTKEELNASVPPGYPEAKNDTHVIWVTGWGNAGVLIEWMFSDVPHFVKGGRRYAATLLPKQDEADEIIRQFRERRHLAGEREWDRLNAEEWATENDPGFYW